MISEKEIFNEEEEDPWKYFKEWQAQKKCGVTLVKNVDYNNDEEKIWQDLTAPNVKNILISNINQKGNYNSL